MRSRASVTEPERPGIREAFPGRAPQEAAPGAYSNCLRRLAVQAPKNNVVSGATGSGKTTLTKALICEIRRDERLVVLEDAAELVLDIHPNSVRLLYSKHGQGMRG